MKLNIGTKLFINLIAVIACLFCFSFLINEKFATMQSKFSDCTALLSRMKESKELQLNIANMWQFITDASLTQDRGVIEKEALPCRDAAVENIKALARMENGDADVRAEIEGLIPRLEKIYGTGLRMFEAYMKNRDEGNLAMDVFDKESESFIKDVEKTVVRVSAEESSIRESASFFIADSRGFIIRSSFFAAFAILLIGFFFKHNISKIIDSIISAAGKINGAVCDGDLAFRADENLVNFEFRCIVSAMNGTMDSFCAPLGEIASRIQSFSQSDIPAMIESEYKGDFASIKNKMNSFIADFNVLKDEMNSVYERRKAGDTDRFVDEKRFGGFFRQMAASLNRSVAMQQEIMEKLLSVLDDYAVKGDFTRNLEKLPGKLSLINEKVGSLKNNLESLVEEIGRMSRCAIEGNLDFRCDSSRFAGKYARIIDGINESLDAYAIPLKEASESLSSVAAGDLSVKVYGKYEGYYEKLKSSLNSSVSSTKDVIAKASLASETLDANSLEISNTSQKLSQACEETAAFVKQIHSKIESAKERSAECSKSSGSAIEFAARTLELSNVGGVRMSELMTAINEITVAMTGISKIIKAIDEIAFQTNILSLNAAVEAARAGKNGKGFSVVAGEVRVLAQKSARAASETAGIIKIALDKVVSGSGIAEEASKTFSQIFGHIEGMKKITEEINGISTGQAFDMNIINDMLAKVDEMTDSNAEETLNIAGAGEALAAAASELKEHISHFKLNRKSGLSREEYGARLNCWEFKNCGREPGGLKAAELGICPAAVTKAADGINGGMNAGRACWAAAGTLCGGKLQGTFAMKMSNCMKCEFYRLVAEQEGENFARASSVMNAMKTLSL